MFLEKEGKLIYSYDGETVCIEAWGKDALRVRATKNRSFTGRDWALEAKDAHAGEVEIFEDPSAKGGALPICMRERILPTEKSQMESFMQ